MRASAQILINLITCIGSTKALSPTVYIGLEWSFGLLAFSAMALRPPLSCHGCLKPVVTAEFLSFSSIRGILGNPREPHSSGFVLSEREGEPSLRGLFVRILHSMIL